MRKKHMISSCKLKAATVAGKPHTGRFIGAKVFACVALAIGLAAAPSAARADSYVFSFTGGGLSGSGTFTTSNTAVPGVPGAVQITGISGTFSDSIANFTGAITGVQATSLPSPINADGTFLPPGSPTDGFGFSYDNLFFPDGNSPAVCPPPLPGDPHEPYPFGGGLFDIYGLLFNVEGGYSVDVWSNGVIPGFGLTYGIGDSLNGEVLNTFGQPFSGTSLTGSVTPVPAETPEPGSLVLLGTGLCGLVVALKRKIKPSTALGA
jgi:hypothetical protein